MSDHQQSDLNVVATGSSNDLYKSSPVRIPGPRKVEELAKRIGIDLSDDEVQEYSELIKGLMGCFVSVEKIPEPTLPVKYPRLPGYRPSAEENPLNAWYWKTNIEGAPAGILKGKSVAIKDNIAVYGVPMMGGSWIIEGYVPEFDATVVTRILDAGGVIKGKSVCEDFCISGESFFGAKGPVLNPHNKQYSAGGSSSGSAALVSAGEVDMAIGGDQGGSIRLPSSICGIVGLKPTHGLVPYTGAQSIEPTVDHLGPMANTVYDCALLLEAIAGYDDGLDPRQNQTKISPVKYTKELETYNLSEFKIGVLKEAFEQKESDPKVNRLIKDASVLLRDAGAGVQEVSVPMHKDGPNMWFCVGYQGVADTLMRGNTVGSGFKGFYPTSLVDAVGRGIQAQPNDLPHTAKLCWMIGEYMKHEYHGRYYGKGQNLGRLLAAEFDKVFQDFDVLLMPTIPYPPSKLPQKDTSITDLITKSYGVINNTIVFNLTGHPALSINAGFIDGLPIGMMLVGKMFDEITLLKVANAYEKLRDSAPK
ncbi:amidase-like [Anneissia japonica]|uniref:amidase-like n=1 Tax=Anneissia japonica TaxID=1529436 RepID=UPI0014258558|nr:amidase-like [Anneissia japonica]